MEFRDTLLAAQRNQQQKSSANSYYSTKFEPPKKDQKPKDKLSANIQKFLAKKEEEERQKLLEVKRKRDELTAMRDPKALKKIQKTLKVIKSANKSVLADAIDNDNTAVTLQGPSQPDEDDYGYESQEAAAIYQKMMEKYSKIPEQPKFPKNNFNNARKDIHGTRERVRHALQHVDDPVPHKRRKRTHEEDNEISPPPQPEVEKKREDKPKVKRPMPPPMDFNELLKLAEQKKCEPIEPVAPKKVVMENEPERPMTKKQRKEYEEEMARKMRRQREIESRKANKEGTSTQDREKKPEMSNKIPKLNNVKSNEATKNSRPNIDNARNQVRSDNKERHKIDIKKDKLACDKVGKVQKEKEKPKTDKERSIQERSLIDKLERERVAERMRMRLASQNVRPQLNVDRKTEQKSSSKNEVVRQDNKKSIDLKSQNTYRIDKNSNERKFVIPNKSTESKITNGHLSRGSSSGKPQQRNESKDKMTTYYKPSFNHNSNSKSSNSFSKPDTAKKSIEQNKSAASTSKADVKKPTHGSGSSKMQVPSKPKLSNSFDFDKHVSSLGKGKKLDGRPNRPTDLKRKLYDDPRRKPQQNKRYIDSEEEEDSEMDDFIDDADEDLDYSKHIQEIFGYNKSRYIDDDDDPNMESNFAQQMREEYISKKIGIMEDLEDMKMEAMEKKMKAKKKRRIDD